jgi:hypothetical protein
VKESRDKTQLICNKKRVVKVHDQPNLCRSMIDFCLESRDTRLQDVNSPVQGDRTVRSPIVFHNITLTELPKEIFVMRDDDKLEISVVLSFVDDAASLLA